MEESKFIIYGAGRLGKGIADLLLKKGKIVIMFWDRNSGKRSQYKGIPIINPYKNEEIVKENKNVTILLGLASQQANQEVLEYLRENGCSKVYPFFESQSNYIIEQLCIENDRIEENCVKCCYAETCSKMINNNLKNLYTKEEVKKSKIINTLFVIVTNRCTLNCKCCGQCTEQIIENKAFFDMTFEDLKKYMEKIFKEVSYIHQVTLSGGEVLLCKELPEILEYLCNLPQIGYIKFLTTSTVKMSDAVLEYLCHPKVVCFIDDYGIEKNISDALQTNIKYNMQKIFEKEIIYSIIDNSDGTWYDLGNMSKRDDIIENVKKNKDCMFRTCLIMSAKGLLSWCTRNTSCLECGLIPDDKRDYCDLSDEKDSQRVKEILELKYLHGCEYCSGTNHNNIVPAGMQIR